MPVLPFKSEPLPLRVPLTESEFGQFWRVYPRHIGKLAAIKAYAKARTLASAEEILAGVERYTRTKPAYADWCHPSTFLTQGRWMDEDDARPAVLEDWRCQHVPPCYNSAAHQVKLARERGEV